MDVNYRSLRKVHKDVLMTYTRDEIIFAIKRNIMPWESPLHTAVRRGDLSTVRTFVTEANVNLRNDYGFTPLNVACYCGHTDIIELLLESGASIHLDDGLGWTPLHAACREDQTATVKLLLDRGAAICVNGKAGKNNDTPLHVACKSMGDRNGYIVKFLVDAGAEVNVENNQGRTPLMTAACKGQSKKVELLLNTGADVHAVDELGSTALHMAVQFPPIVKLLIDAGADVNVRNKRDETPLEGKKLSIVSAPLLLEHGAGVGIPCMRHKSCKRSSLLKCLYKSARTTAKKGRGCEKLNFLERHIIKLETARLYAGDGSSLFQPPLELEYWNTVSRDEFRIACKTELASMKTECIPGTSSTYLDALLQRPFALSNVNRYSLEHCRAKFQIYGELIWSRFCSGQRRRPLIGEAIHFFFLAEEIPLLVPPECFEEILSYLSERDLKTLISIYDEASQLQASKRRQGHRVQNNNKRAKIN